jgi:hypothetical protein
MNCITEIRGESFALQGGEDIKVAGVPLKKHLSDNY